MFIPGTGTCVSKGRSCTAVYKKSNKRARRGTWAIRQASNSSEPIQHLTQLWVHAGVRQVLHVFSDEELKNLGLNSQT